MFLTRNPLLYNIFKPSSQLFGQVGEETPMVKYLQNLKTLPSLTQLDISSSSSSGGGNPHTRKKWISDVEEKLFTYLLSFEYIEPNYLVKDSFCKDRKSAYVYVRRLESKGVLKKVKRGIYKVNHNTIYKLLHLPVKKVKTPFRKEEKTTKEPVRPVRQANDTRVGSVGFGVGGVGFGGGFGYLGLFFDNVRWLGFDGLFHQLGRSCLLGLSGLDLGFRTTYCEVTHVVGGGVVDGVVVIYSNVEDFSRFGRPVVRVEYRPPSGYVKRNGIASTLLYAKEELIKAFKSLVVVLKEVLSTDKLLELLNWTSWVWGLNRIR